METQEQICSLGRQFCGNTPTLQPQIGTLASMVQPGRRIGPSHDHPLNCLQCIFFSMALLGWRDASLVPSQDTTLCQGHLTWRSPPEFRPTLLFTLARVHQSLPLTPILAPCSQTTPISELKHATKVTQDGYVHKQLLWSHAGRLG